MTITARPTTDPLASLDRLLDRLDTEDDDDIRADLIEEVFALLDRHPDNAELRDAAVGYSDRFTA